MLKYRVWQPGRQAWWISNGRRPPTNVHTCAHTDTHTAKASMQTITTSWFTLRRGEKKAERVLFLYQLMLLSPLSPLTTMTEGGEEEEEGCFFHPSPLGATDLTPNMWATVSFIIDSGYLKYTHSLSVQPPFISLSESLFLVSLITISGILEIQIVNPKFLFQAAITCSIKTPFNTFSNESTVSGNAMKL